MTESRIGRAVFRFFRVVGGAGIGQALSAIIAAAGAYEYTTPEGVLVGTALIPILVAIDKYFRDKPTVNG